MPALTMYPIFSIIALYSNSSTFSFQLYIFLTTKYTTKYKTFLSSQKPEKDLFFGIQYTTFWAMEVEIALQV